MAIGSSSLSENNDLYGLQHVSISQPVGIGSTLRFDGTNFVNVPDKINTLLDANIVNPNNNDFLVRQGDYWENVSATACFSILSPQTAKGDLIGFDGTAPSRVPSGIDGQALVSNSSAPSGLSWATIQSGTSMLPVVKATTTFQLTTNTAYIVNTSAQITLTLPDNMAFGDVIQITGFKGGYSLAQNTDQIVHLGNTQSSSGSGVVVSSTNANDSLTLRCATDASDGPVSHIVITSCVGNFLIRT